MSMPPGADANADANDDDADTDATTDSAAAEPRAVTTASGALGPTKPGAPVLGLPVRQRPSTFISATLARPFAAGFALTLGGLIAIVLALAISGLSSILIAIALALFIALGLDPVVRRIQRWGASRAWAIVIVSASTVLVFLGIIGVLIPIIAAQLASFIRDLPQLINQFLASSAYAWVQEYFGDGIADLLKQVQSFILDPATLTTIGGGVLQVGAGIIGGVSTGIIVFVLTLYFTASLESMKRGFYRLAPAWSRPRLADLTERITQSVGSYLMGMVVLAFFNSLVTLVLYLALGLPFPPLMAVGAFFITIIPLIGTVAFWVIGSSVALFVDPLGALIFAIIYLVYMQVEAYVLTPRVMNRAISVPGSLVVIGAMVGGALLGFLGALVAIPVTASILLIINEVVIPHQDAKESPEPA